MRRYLYVRPDGGGVIAGEISRAEAVDALWSGKDPRRERKVNQQLDEAGNGAVFTAWSGEAVVIVLVG